MHDAAYRWVTQFGTGKPLELLDIGGRFINGSACDHFPGAFITALDIEPGPGVAVVADAATWTPPDSRWDVVLCTEVFEHTPHGQAIVATAAAALRPGGRLIVTCAGPGRLPHSGRDGGALRPGEYYGNVPASDLVQWLDAAGFVDVTVEYAAEPRDTYGTGIKPGENPGGL